MKKNISFIPMDSILSKWLYDKLKREPPETACVDELMTGLHELMTGEVSTLMLGAQDGMGSFPGTADDGICVGELSVRPKNRKVMFRGVEVMAFIRKLRKKIEPNPDAPEYILTIWGIGYKFNDNL